MTSFDYFDSFVLLYAAGSSSWFYNMQLLCYFTFIDKADTEKEVVDEEGKRSCSFPV